MRKTKTFLLLLSIFLNTALWAQEVVVSGTVKDKEGNPLPGVNVVLKGSTNVGVVTDIDGKYKVRLPNQESTLVFSFIGYKTLEQQVAGRTTVDVVMEEETTELEQVVVIGYGVEKKKLVTGSTVNVGGETIQGLKTNSPIEALKGITPGVSVTQNNGLPGSGSKVIIRGIGTNGNYAPLYVVDGVVVGNIDYLSPSDIESIDILKDAATSAIYGSRAANGVVLVKTKSGSYNAKPTVTYDGYYGVSNIAKTVQLLNAKQYMEIYDEAQVNSGLKPTDWAKYVPDYNKIMSGEWNGTNWLDEITNKDAPTQSHTVNITGGSKNVSYSLGGSYFSEEGILGKDYQTNNEYQRTTVRMNTSFVIWEKAERSIFTVGENLTYSNYKNPSFRQGNIYWNDLHNMLVASPLYPVYDTAGNYHRAIAWNADDVNPIALMEYNEKYNYNNNNNIVASVFGELSPIKGLTIRSSYGVTNWYGSTRQWIPVYDLGPKTLTTRDQVSQGMYNGSSWVWTNTATFTDKIKDHTFTFLLGHEMSKTSQDLNINGHNENSLFNDPEYAYLSNVPVVDATYTTVTGKDNYGHAILSYFGRLSYDYKETYMLTFVLRADGSSNFASGKRWGQFPSVSAGWVISNESFMDWSKSWLNSWKLRASWGQNGNENIPKNFQYLSQIAYNNDADYFFGTDKTVRTVGSSPAYVPNPDLSWETSQQLDLGTDIYVFKNRMQLSFDYYDKTTKDWLVQAPALAAWGTDAPYINGGTVSNKGFEGVIRWNDQIGDFKYGLSVSLAYNKNKVTEINSSDSILHGQSNVLSQGTGEMYRAEVGYPMGFFYGFKTDGVFQDSAEVEAFTRGKASYYRKDRNGNLVNTIKPGDQRYVDMNGDTIIDDKDKVMIGDPNPHYILGVQLNLEYKGFYIQATGNGAFGMQVAKSYRSFVDGAKQNYTIDVYDRWHGYGTSNKMPRLTAVASNKISDIYIHDADFFRISNITIGYDFKKLIKALPVTEAKLYVTAKNLYTFTKYDGFDPEVGYGPDSWSSGIDLGLYPSSRTYLVGLSVKF
jgi:TonB-linked SusC/RagA family outer membrane protein